MKQIPEVTHSTPLQLFLKLIFYIYILRKFYVTFS